MKHKLILTLFSLLLIVVANAQNVGVGTTTPHAFFNVAAGQTVLFGTDTTSEENKLMWLPAKGAFRAGYYAGSMTDFFGLYSTAMGYNNVALGNYSTAIGGNNFAIGNYSTAMGNNTAAYSNNETVIGINNDFDNANCLFEIGDGKSTNSRSNALTVLNNGMVGIGTMSPQALLEIDYASSTPQLLLNQLSSDPSARLTFQNTLGQSWALAVSRNSNSALDAINFYDYQVDANRVTFFGNGNASFAGTVTQNSDERLKTNIHSINNVLPVLNSINAYTYNWKEKNRGSDEQIGFLAQEIEKVYPQLVRTDDKGIKSVAYQNMVPILLQAIKEQQSEFEQQKQKVGQLQQNNLVLQQQMETLLNTVTTLNKQVQTLAARTNNQNTIAVNK